MDPLRYRAFARLVAARASRRAGLRAARTALAGNQPDTCVGLIS